MDKIENNDINTKIKTVLISKTWSMKILIKDFDFKNPSLEPFKFLTFDPAK